MALDSEYWSSGSVTQSRLRLKIRGALWYQCFLALKGNVLYLGFGTTGQGAQCLQIATCPLCWGLTHEATYTFGLQESDALGKQLKALRDDPNSGWVASMDDDIPNFVAQIGALLVQRATLRKDLSRYGAQWVTVPDFLAAAENKSLTRYSIETRRVEYSDGVTGIQFRAYHDLGNWLYYHFFKDHFGEAATAVCGFPDLGLNVEHLGDVCEAMLALRKVDCPAHRSLMVERRHHWFPPQTRGSHVDMVTKDHISAIGPLDPSCQTR